MSTKILDADAILRASVEETGLDDWGDDTLPARFAIAVDAIRAAGVDEQGERAAAAVCRWLLTSRLHFFEDHKRDSLADEVVDRPVFATGEPRSGTTLLHALLACDPDARALRFWEVMYPSPPPGLAGPDDPRRRRADEDWRDILRKLPRWLVIHPYNDMLGDGLPECERVWAFDFRVLTPTAWWRVPMGINYGGLPADPTAQYRLHKMMLQHCQRSRPRKHWALKGFHSGRLQALFEAYPDAHVIWTHRDPVQVIASRIAMITELEEGLTGIADPHAVAERYLAIGRANVHEVATNPFVDDPRVHHVRYGDFITDPVGTIRGFYEDIGRSMTADAEAAMRAYLRDNKSDRYGRFTYTTAIIRTDVDALHAEFAGYRERFGLEIEQSRDGSQ